MSTATQYASGSAAEPDLSQEPLSVYITRVFRAPRERVFEAWTKPEQMLKWRGPEGWTVVEAHSDLKPGGEHRVVVRGVPQSKLFGEVSGEVTGASYGTYLDVEPYSLIRFTWNADWSPGEESVVTVRLTEAEEGGTLMDFTHDRFLTANSAKGHNQGWNSAFNRLEKFLEG